MAKKKRISKVGAIFTEPKEPAKEVKPIDYDKIEKDYQAATGNNTTIGRPKKNVSANRVKLTTKLNESLIKYLKIEAVERGVSNADFLEDIIIDYIRNNPTEYEFSDEIKSRLSE